MSSLSLSLYAITTETRARLQCEHMRMYAMRLMSGGALKIVKFRVRHYRGRCSRRADFLELLRKSHCREWKREYRENDVDRLCRLADCLHFRMKKERKHRYHLTVSGFRLDDSFE